MDKVFADGFIVKDPSPNAPDFVKGKISIKVDEFIPFLEQHQNNGWVNLDLQVSKTGKLYAQLNTYKKTEAENFPVIETIKAGQTPIDPEDIPF